MLPTRSFMLAVLLGSAALARADEPLLATLGEPVEVVEQIAPRASLRREFGEGIGYDRPESCCDSSERHDPYVHHPSALP